jgi:D-Tyr-tRNAtyr deacylase
MPRSRKSRKGSRKSRKGSRKSRKGGKCREYLSAKIKKNMAEYKKGKYSSRMQAVAVSYSQVKKAHPNCTRALSKKK